MKAAELRAERKRSRHAARVCICEACLQPKGDAWIVQTGDIPVVLCGACRVRLAEGDDRVSSKAIATATATEMLHRTGGPRGSPDDKVPV